MADLRGRQDYAALTCELLRLEGAGGTVLYNQPFSRILNGRPFHDCLTASHGKTFAVAFYSVSDGIQANRIPAALAPVESITRKIYPLLRELPESVRERLRLPDIDNWWRIVFHLGWHFPEAAKGAARGQAPLGQQRGQGSKGVKPRWRAAGQLDQPHFALAQVHAKIIRQRL